ncbi:hypothetical protein HETIRDRAFT_101688 [Heterobasidion irregulare TC 32-1]|uniref:Uncharacterized protein n=1 Tax=Heterobasidion irregulare (strain TC 32-1) TaxID=747525 RepID=W4K407_HETIT|nr:uncharacterized protein HETIRDRAFT_101688 [Heterobasidion irregulare TC 32-1]ETW80547.1 hypothetical protein HETIRDRAFT_101688 [Heterobasidion irregulare TC 32-1]
MSMNRIVIATISQRPTSSISLRVCSIIPQRRHNPATQRFSRVVTLNKLHSTSVPHPPALVMLSASNSLELPASTASAIKQTLAQLYQQSSFQLNVQPAPFLSASDDQVPSEVQTYLHSLTLAANAVANENACGSVLAGQGSESDEFGDVACWLGQGEYGPGRETDVLQALGLQNWSQNNRKIQHADLQSTYLPPSFRPSSTPELEKLTSLLSILQDKYYFFMDGGEGMGGCVAHLLLGNYRGDAKSGFGGWIGIIGLGTWSDY